MAKETAASRASRKPAVTDSAPAANVLRDLLEKKRPLIMGVLNVTPDSFSDGGRFLDPAAAIAQAQRLAAEGADILDIGAESSRPYGNAVAVPLDEERARLAPILPAVVALGIPVSIDTMKAAVAAWALEPAPRSSTTCGGCSATPTWRTSLPGTMRPSSSCTIAIAADPRIDIVADVTAFFERSLAIAARAGIPRERIVLDPGIGFGKTPEQSLTCIARLDAWRGFGLPLLVGASRKRFIHSIVPSEPAERLGGSLAAHLLAVENGAAIIRVHDVAPTVQALAVAAAIRRAR